MANANDNFTGSDGTELSTHNSDSGHSWTKREGDNLNITTNRVYGDANATATVYYISAVPASAEYDVQADITTTFGNSTPAIVGRADTVASTEYYVFYHIADNYWVLEKRVNGVRTNLGTYYTSAAPTTRAVKLEIRDAAKKVFLDSVEVISSADNAITSAGRAGIGKDLRVTSTSAGTYLDNWSVTDAAGGAALLKIYNEAVNSTSANQRLMAMNRPVAETQSLTEGTLRRGGLLRVIGDALSVVEEVLKASAFVRAIGESVSLAGAAIRRSALVRLANSAVGISEGALKSISALLVRVVTGTVQAAEGAARRLFLSRYAGEDLAVTEGTLRRGSLLRVIGDALSVVEGVLRCVAFIRAIGESVSLAEASIRRSALVRLVASTVQAAEGAAPVRGFVRVVSEALSVVEGVVKGAVDALGTLSDNLSVIFVTIRRGVLSRSRKREVRS